MTWNELADALCIDLIDLLGDQEQADEMGNLQLFRCILLDELVSELNDNHENMPIVRGINKTLKAHNEPEYWLVYR